jgi:hypothetical protein
VAHEQAQENEDREEPGDDQPHGRHLLVLARPAMTGTISPVPGAPDLGRPAPAQPWRSRGSTRHRRRSARETIWRATVRIARVVPVRTMALVSCWRRSASVGITSQGPASVAFVGMTTGRVETVTTSDVDKGRFV